MRWLAEVFNVGNYSFNVISSFTVEDNNIVGLFNCSQNGAVNFITEYFEYLRKRIRDAHCVGSGEWCELYFNIRAFPFCVDWEQVKLTPRGKETYKLEIPIDNNVKRNLKRCFASLLRACVLSDTVIDISRKNGTSRRYTMSHIREHMCDNISYFNSDNFYCATEFLPSTDQSILDAYTAAIKLNAKNCDYQDFWRIDASRSYSLYNIDNAILIKNVVQKLEKSLIYLSLEDNDGSAITILKNAITELILARTGIEISEYCLINDGSSDHNTHVLMKNKSGGNLSHEEADEICNVFSLSGLKHYQGNYVFPVGAVARLMSLVEKHSIIRKGGNNYTLKIEPRLYFPRDVIEGRLKKIYSGSYTHKCPVQLSVAKSISQTDETPIAQLVRMYNVVNYCHDIAMNFKLENNNLKIMFSAGIKVDQDTFKQYIDFHKEEMKEKAKKNLHRGDSNDVKKNYEKIEELINHIFATTDGIKAEPGANNTLTIPLNRNALLYLKKQVSFLLIHPIMGKCIGSSMDLPSDENSCQYRLTFPSLIVQYRFTSEFQVTYQVSFLYAFTKAENKGLHFNDIFDDFHKLYIQDLTKSLACLCLRKDSGQFEKSITKYFIESIRVTPSLFKYLDLKDDRPDLPKCSKDHLKKRLILVLTGEEQDLLLTERQASEFNEKFGHEVLTDIKDKTSSTLLNNVRGKAYGIDSSDRKGYHIICEIIENAEFGEGCKLVFNPVESSERASNLSVSEVSIHQPGTYQGCRPKERKRS